MGDIWDSAVWSWSWDGSRLDKCEGNCLSPLFRDLALQRPRGVHFDVAFEVFLRGSFLSLSAMAGWAASDRAGLRSEGQQKAGLRGTRGGLKEAWRVGCHVEMAGCA